MSHTLELGDDQSYLLSNSPSCQWGVLGKVASESDWDRLNHGGPSSVLSEVVAMVPLDVCSEDGLRIISGTISNGG